MIEVWKYPIERINELIPDSIWQLHSEFTNGVNLVDEAGNLLFIGTDKNGELPFGLHLTFRNLVHFKAELNKNTRFHYHNLTFVNQENLEYSLSLKNSTPYSVALEKKGQLNSDAVGSLFKWSSKEEKKRNGLGEYLPTTEFILDNWMIENKQAIGYLFSENPVEIQHGLRYFIGRGQGLTPSGDDFLVGLLSLEKGFSIIDNQFEIILETFVSSEKLTTDISEAYLQAALKGRFSTSINQLIDVLAGTKNKTALPDILTKIIQNGHTSGIDTLTGILVGLLIGTKDIKKGAS